jgi:hypothetical protein
VKATFIASYAVKVAFTDSCSGTVELIQQQIRAVETYDAQSGVAHE